MVIRFLSAHILLSFYMAVTAYGDLGDPASALWLFAHFSEYSTRTWNVLLGALAECGSKVRTVRPSTSIAAKAFHEGGASMPTPRNDLLRHSTVVDVAQLMLNAMTGAEHIAGMNAPIADSQSFCVAASALQFGTTGAPLATELFRNATAMGIPADGRFVNAVLRCFGDEVDAALASWRNEIRPLTVAFENRARPKPISSNRRAGKNLLAGYNGLLYVCGRALRPDIAVRLAYAMNKEGLEPNEHSLNSYRAGKRLVDTGGSLRSRLARKLKLIDPYESILYVECTKYDRNDRRRTGEKRVRIIV